MREQKIINQTFSLNSLDSLSTKFTREEWVALLESGMDAASQLKNDFENFYGDVTPIKRFKSEIHSVFDGELGQHIGRGSDEHRKLIVKISDLGEDNFERLFEICTAYWINDTADVERISVATQPN